MVAAWASLSAPAATAAATSSTLSTGIDFAWPRDFLAAARAAWASSLAAERAWLAAIFWSVAAWSSAALALTPSMSCWVALGVARLGLAFSVVSANWT